MPADRVTRRSVLMTALGGASMLAIPWELVAGEFHHHGLDVPPATGPILSVGERRLLDAIVAQIVPGDASSPGAREAGVVEFIERALGTFFARFVPEFRAELTAFESSFANSRPGAKTFADRPVDEQIAWLEQIQSGAFFALLRQLTVLGMFSSPEYGGNRDGCGWALLGFVDQHVFTPPFGWYDAEYAGFVVESSR
jgi:gluconate 2-dehydrogenase gamma chain